jgi:hypothetical protein
MKKWALAVSFWSVLALTCSTGSVQAAENIPSVLPAENVEENDDISLVDKQIYERLKQFVKNCEQKKYAERLKRFSENEWDAAGWYLFMLDQVVNEGENCEFLKWYDKPLRVNAITVLELEIEQFLAENE